MTGAETTAPASARAKKILCFILFLIDDQAATTFPEGDIAPAGTPGPQLFRPPIIKACSHEKTGSRSSRFAGEAERFERPAD